MDTTILQIPMSKKLKKEAEAAARDMGFSSLQESVRVILTKLSKRELSVEIKEQFPAEEIHLSARAKKRYEKAVQDIESGKNLYKPKNTKELMKWLHE